MPTQIELLEEANRRGILPKNKRALFEEAQRRGLVGGEAPASSNGGERPGYEAPGGIEGLGLRVRGAQQALSLIHI